MSNRAGNLHAIGPMMAVIRICIWLAMKRRYRISQCDPRNWSIALPPCDEAVQCSIYIQRGGLQRPILLAASDFPISNANHISVQQKRGRVRCYRSSSAKQRFDSDHFDGKPARYQASYQGCLQCGHATQCLHVQLAN